ncbi:MAG: sugar phosphate isomerase/epimerase [Chloroflexota bacterium]|nr:sugar phosphate isomerase/epimerase [Chloroflexota bacterium]
MDQPLLNYMRPGIVLCVAYPGADGDGNALVRGIEAVASDIFFSSVEVRHVPDEGARRRMVEILRGSRLDIVYETYPRLRQLGLSLGSADPASRRRAVEEAKRAIDDAVSIGAIRVNLISGPDPGQAGRDEGADVLVDSLYALAEYASGQRGLALALEPFPRDGLDAALIGPMGEAVKLVRLVREVYPDVGLTLDTAHTARLGEDFAASLALAAPYLGQLHLSNLAPGSPNPAPPFGASGGFYDTPRLTDALLALFRAGFLGAGHRPFVTFRVAPDAGDRTEWIIAGAKRTLTEAWTRL